MRDGSAQRNPSHQQVDDRLAGCERPDVRRVDVPVVDEEGHAVDTCGGVAVEERHRVAHLLRGVRRGAGGLPVVLRERQPQVGVGPGEGSVGRPGADRIDPNALRQEGKRVCRDIGVNGLLAGAVVAEELGLAGFYEGICRFEVGRGQKLLQAGEDRFPIRCRPLTR